MKRGDFHAYTSQFAGKKVCDLARTINDSNDLVTILKGVNMPSQIYTRKYIEDNTKEIRDVIVIKLGISATLEICFYK